MGLEYIAFVLVCLTFLFIAGVAVAVFWPSRFSMRGMLILITWFTIALGLATAMYHWQR